MKKPPARTKPPAKAPQAQPQQNGGTVIEHRSWSGPLPHPGDLAEYNKLVPNGAARLFQQFEDEAAHRREMEKADLAERIRERKTAQWMAGAFAFSGLAVSVVALLLGHENVAGIIAGTTIVGVVTTFLARSRRAG